MARLVTFFAVSALALASVAAMHHHIQQEGSEKSGLIKKMICEDLRRSDVLPVAKECWSHAPRIVTVPMNICKADAGERKTDDFAVLDKACADPQLFHKMHKCLHNEIKRNWDQDFGDDDKLGDFATCVADIYETISQGKHFPTTLSPLQESRVEIKSIIEDMMPYWCKIIKRPGELKTILNCMGDLPHIFSIPQRICKADIGKSHWSQRQLATNLCEEHNHDLSIQYGVCVYEEFTSLPEHFEGEEEKEHKTRECAMDFLEKVEEEKEAEKKREENSAENQV